MRSFFAVKKKSRPGTASIGGWAAFFNSCKKQLNDEDVSGYRI
jgi:hypothetical protein